MRTLSQFISFGLFLGGPPEFPFRVSELELPPEVSALRDLRPLLAAFYQEADLGALGRNISPPTSRNWSATMKVWRN